MIPRPPAENEEPSLGSLKPIAGEVCLEGDLKREGKVMHPSAVKQAQTTTPTGREKPAGSHEVEEKGGKDGGIRAVNRSVVVDLTNNSTFEVYNSDEDNSQMEMHINQDVHAKKELQKSGVDSSSLSLSKEADTVPGKTADGLNDDELLAQQEEILEQIRRDQEAEMKTKELVAKLALGAEGEGGSKQVAAEEKQDERPIGTDLSEFIVVAVKKRQMKKARKSGGGASEAASELRKSGGEENTSHQKNEETMVELEVERKKAKDLIRQSIAAKETEIQATSKRHEAASRAIEEARKKRMAAEKKRQLSMASSSRFKPSWEKQSELAGPSQGNDGGIRRSYGK